MMSAGSMSLVNWMRWKCRPSDLASTCASVVLPTPGRSSIKRCPRASRQASARRTAIEDQLIASGIGQHLVRHDAPLATDEQLARVHPIEYVRTIRDAAPE